MKYTCHYCAEKFESEKYSDACPTCYEINENYKKQRVKKWRENRMKKGLCLRCGKPTNNNFVYCNPCKVLTEQKGKNYYYANREEQLKKRKEYYNENREYINYKKRMYYQANKEKLKEKYRNYYHERKEKKLIEEKQKQLSEYHKTYNKNYTSEKLSNGFCFYCKNERENKNVLGCNKCMQYRREKLKENRLIKFQQGKCISCNNYREQKDKKYCNKCLVKYRIYSSKWRKNAR